MAHGGMTPEQGFAYKKYLKKLSEDFAAGAMLLDDADKLYISDKVEDARWMTGPTYNRGVHMLLDVVQLAVEASYASPNLRIKKCQE